MNRSIVTESIGKARQTVLLAFAISLASVAVLVAEIFAMDTLVAFSAANLREAALITGEILLADERLTSSAKLAAATGDARWISRYEENIAILDGAIAKGKQLAPPLAQHFIDETYASNNHLISLERRSFALARNGSSAQAQAILEGAEYASQKQILADASHYFRAAFLAFEEGNLRRLQRWGQWMTLGVVVIAVTVLLFAWRRLTQSLNKSRDIYLDIEKSVRWLAHHDSLTGLPNRHKFLKELHIARASLQRDERCAVLLVDLDRFKPINDLYGHRVGDEVLRVVGARLKDIVGDRGVTARLGGDEFGILISMKSGERAFDEVARRIVQEIPQPIRLAALSVKVGATVGLAICSKIGDEGGLLTSQDGSAAETSIRQADMALHQAKSDGRGRYHVFTKGMDEALILRIELEREIKPAIEQGQIVPYYQPLVDLKSGAVIGFEALARWEHPKRGLLSPAVLIPIAEDTGTISEMTYSMLRQALCDAQTWPDGLSISINLSPRQFGDHSLAETILRILSEHSFAPQRLEVEITETALIDKFDEVRTTIESLRNLGVRIALDDFGAGFAGLSYLRELKFDRIKIDGSFVTNMLARPEDQKLVETILSLGRAFGLETTAEGIENRDTCDKLLKLGCRTGQGFYFGKPQSNREIQRYLVNLEDGVRQIA